MEIEPLDIVTGGHQLEALGQVGLGEGDSGCGVEEVDEASGSRDTAQLDMQLNGASIKFASVKAILDAEPRK